MSELCLKRSAQACLLIASIALAACQSSVPAPAEIDLAADPRRGAAVDTVCFSGRLAGFTSIADRALVLKRTRSEAYLVETGFCPNADQAEAIALPQGFNCLSRGDRLFIHDTPFPDGDDLSERTNSCRILDIHAWNEADTDQPEKPAPRHAQE